MSNRIVVAPELGEPVGFAHAVISGTGRTVHLGGQTALGPDGKIHGRTIVEQMDVVCGNVVTALAAAGGAPEDLVSIQIFVTNVGDYKRHLRDLGDVWKQHFGRHYPAMGLFGISRLFDDDAQVELMCVAVVPEDRLS